MASSILKSSFSTGSTSG